MKIKITLLILIVFLFLGILYAQVTQEWVALYNITLYTNVANSIAVDGLGNVYVTGRSGLPAGAISYDYATIKYNSSGVQQWVQRYNGPANGDDYSYAIIVDAIGNVYVSGWSEGKGTNFDYATIKYNSSGVQQWVQRYNGPVNNRDGANALAIDAAGNIYVTGVSYKSGFSRYDDYTTIKYNSAGDSVWVKSYNGPGNWYDGATSVAVDGSGNVFVTGYSSASSGSYNDYATIKYNFNGDSVWVVRYNGLANYIDYANSIAVDSSGNVYITGYSWGSGSNYDFSTIKYNSSGVQQWDQRYNGPGNNADYPNAMVLDNSGNVIVTGVSMGNGTDSDYATIKYNSSGNEQWVQRFNGAGNWKDYARDLAADGLGNVYVTGWSYGGASGYDYATIKYSTAGQQQWVQIYNNYSDGGNAITLDSSGYIYITGASSTGPPLSYYRYATIKYSQTVGIKHVSSEIPINFSLYQNYPNPFNPVTKIRFDNPVGTRHGTFVRINIYDILGREIATLVNEQLKAGTYEVEWDGTNYPSGVYYYKISAGEFVETKKMVLAK